MCGSMADIQSAAAEIRRGNKKRRRRTNHSMKILWSALFHRATIKNCKYQSKKTVVLLQHVRPIIDPYKTAKIHSVTSTAVDIIKTVYYIHGH